MSLPFALLSFITPTVLQLYFAGVVFKKRLRFSIGREIAILAAVLTVTVFLCIYHVYGSPAKEWHYVAIIIFLLCFAAALFLMFRVSPLQIIFTFFMVTTCLDCVFSLGKLVQVYVLGDLLPADISFAVSYSIVLVIIAPIMQLILGRLLRPLVEQEKGIRGTSVWNFLWAIPVFFFIIYKAVISFDYSSPSEYLGDPPILVILVWSACLILSYYVILRALAQAAKQAELQEKLRISNLLLSLQEREYRRWSVFIEETARKQHDRKHYLLLIKSYVESGQLSKLEDMIDNELSSLQESSAFICENYTADMFIRYYMDLAAAQGICFEHCVKLPQSLAVSEQELCVALGNILENALEACGRQKSGERFISIRAEITGKDVVAISVKNSYEGTIIPSGSGRFLSAKREKEGIGVASVQNIVSKNNGMADFRYQDGIFTARILLNPPQGKG